MTYIVEDIERIISELAPFLILGFMVFVLSMILKRIRRKKYNAST